MGGLHHDISVEPVLKDFFLAEQFAVCHKPGALNDVISGTAGLEKIEIVFDDTGQKCSLIDTSWTT